MRRKWEAVEIDNKVKEAVNTNIRLLIEITVYKRGGEEKLRYNDLLKLVRLRRKSLAI